MGRFPRALSCLLAVLGLTLTLGLLIWTLWLGVNSDKDNIHPLLNHLIPAGHCACETSTIFQCGSCLQCPVSLPSEPTSQSNHTPNTFDREEISYNETQCHSLFPGLFQDPERAESLWTSRNGIDQTDLDEIHLVNGMTRASIHNGRLYIIQSLSKGDDHRRKTLGILSSIHRALISAPDRHAIPNTEFVFSVEDKLSDVAGPHHPLWVMARKATEESVWLMPDFGFWSWGNLDSHIGPYDLVVEQVARREPSWEEKKEVLVWRGKLSFAPKLRRTLLEVSRGESWGDVKEVEWKSRANYLSMEDHCDYRFIAHVEGRSYSASLKYRQACRSVVVMHKLQYIQHHHYLLVASGPHQNYVQVERDFSDLAEKMRDLLENPAKAERIAQNSVNVFRERYLTPAAEVCYWRALLGAWTAASPGLTARSGLRGLRFESFLLLNDELMDRFVSDASV